MPSKATSSAWSRHARSSASPEIRRRDRSASKRRTGRRVIFVTRMRGPVAQRAAVTVGTSVFAYCDDDGEFVKIDGRAYPPRGFVATERFEERCGLRELTNRFSKRRLGGVDTFALCTEAQMTEDSADGAREHDVGHEPRAPLRLTEGDLQRCAVEKDAESVANLNTYEV